MKGSMSFWNAVRRIFIACMVIGIAIATAGCGGGGGGGGSNGTGGGSSTRITINSVDGVTSEVYDSQMIPPINIGFRVSGDLTVFRGQPLVVVLEMRDADLFESPPYISISSDNMGGIVSLAGKLWKGGPTVRTGNIVIHACLDFTCSSEIPVDGGTIPYKVTIKQGVSVPVSVINLTAPYGSLPAEQVIPVTLPDNAIGWTVRQFSGLDAVSARKASDGSNNLVISQPVATPVGYSNTEEVVITAETMDHQIVSKILTVNVSTLESTIPYAFRLSHPTISILQGQPTISGSVDATLLLKMASANTVRYTGTTFTDWPSQATDPVLRESWLDAYMVYGTYGPPYATTQYPISIRVMSCLSGGCLPAGTYTAHLHFEFTPPGGTAAQLDLPVTMIVTPAP